MEQGNLNVLYIAFNTHRRNVSQTTRPFTSDPETLHLVSPLGYSQSGLVQVGGDTERL